MDSVKEIKVVDASTGEIRWQKVSYYSDWMENRGYKYRYRQYAIRSFADVTYPKELSILDIGRLHVLSKHTTPNTNMLACKTRNGYKPMSVKELGEIISLKERHAYSFVKDMCEAGMIGKIIIQIDGASYAKYFMNPVYFLRGLYLDATLYYLFQESLDATLPDEVRERFLSMKP